MEERHDHDHDHDHDYNGDQLLATGDHEDHNTEQEPIMTRTFTPRLEHTLHSGVTHRVVCRHSGAGLLPSFILFIGVWKTNLRSPSCRSEEGISRLLGAELSIRIICSDT